MKPVEALQTGAAWQAAITGSLGSAELGGGTLNILPMEVGFDMLAHAGDTLDTLANLAESPDSIIGAVVAAIKYVVSSLKKAAAQRELNYSEARCGYLASVRGVRLVSKLPGFQGCAAGNWLYPRASIAIDHCVPIWDPIGTPGTVPAWSMPSYWRNTKGNVWWPADSAKPVGQTLPDVCFDWEDINLDNGSSNCDFDKNAYMTIAWPWAWPLTSPLRTFGSHLRYSQGPEDVIAAQYALPTPQHVLTNSWEVEYSKQVIKRAMLYFWPAAYEAAPGDWRNNGDPLPFEKREKSMQYISGAAFHLYAAAMARIAGWERCRAAILADRTLVPAELQKLYAQNSDFAAAPPPPAKPKPQVGQVGGLKGVEAPSSGDGLGDVLLAGLALKLLGGIL